MKYFDFHLHVSTKSSLCVDKSAWDKIEIAADAPGWIKEFRNVIDSQANMKMLIDHGYELIVAPLVGLEKAFANNLLIKNALTKYSPLDKTNIRRILNGKVSYHKSFQNDFKNLVDSISQKPDQVVLISSATDYDSQKLNVLISIEGAHCLDEKGTDALQNFKDFKSKCRVFYLTLTHLSRAKGCNHAYGIKVKVSLTGKKTDEEIDDVELTAMGTNHEFMPWGKGFFFLGADLVKECYQQPKEKITLVDIKHLSFYSRQYLYQARIANQWTHIPLVASHMGVTGTSYNNTYVKRWAGEGEGQTRRLKFWRKKGLANTLFNPWTINLFDEEILLILQSKGLIGISLDQRIVGAGKVYAEIFSTEELLKNDPLSLYRYVKKSIANPNPSQYVPWNEVESGDENEESPEDFLRDVLDNDGDAVEEPCIPSFINNLLHIVKTGLKAGFDGTNGKVHVWDQVCIGSDLDGLIDSLDFGSDKLDCVTASTMDRFVERLKVAIPALAAHDPDGFDYQLTDINEKMDKLFYSNGKAFALRFLNGTLF